MSGSQPPLGIYFTAALGLPFIAPGGVIQRRDPCGDPGESDCAACVLRRGGAFGWANGKGQG